MSRNPPGGARQRTAKHSPQANECTPDRPGSSEDPGNEAHLFSIAGNLIALDNSFELRAGASVLLNRESPADKPENACQVGRLNFLQSPPVACQIFGPYFKRRAA